VNQPRRAALSFIFITVVLDVLSLGVTIPVLPTLVAQFFDGDVAAAAPYYGLFATVWAMMQFLVAPVMGALSDRFGRRPVLLLSCLGLGLDYMLMAWAPTLWLLFIGRVISGITAASFATAAAYIADVTPPEKRAASYALFGAAWGFGFVLGPAVGGALSVAYGLRVPFWVSAGLTLLNAAYGYFVLPESLPKESRKPFAWSRANPLGSLRLLRSHPELLSLASIILLYQLAHQVLQSVFVYYAMYRYGWRESRVGYTLMAVGIASIIVQAFLVRKVAGRLTERTMLYVGLTFGAIGYTIYGIAPNEVLFWCGIPVFALVGFFSPAIQGLMTKRVRVDEQGQLQGANSSLMGIAGMIGPSIFANLFEQASLWSQHSSSPVLGKPFYLAVGVPFFFAATLHLVAFIIAASVFAKSRDAAPPSVVQ
jgi:DHA1 family tetracycline resistance protein-like MFS transporter